MESGGHCQQLRSGAVLPAAFEFTFGREYRLLILTA